MSDAGGETGGIRIRLLSGQRHTLSAQALHVEGFGSGLAGLRHLRIRTLQKPKGLVWGPSYPVVHSRVGPPCFWRVRTRILIVRFLGWWNHIGLFMSGSKLPVALYAASVCFCVHLCMLLGAFRYVFNEWDTFSRTHHWVETPWQPRFICRLREKELFDVVSLQVRRWTRWPEKRVSPRKGQVQRF